VSRFVRGSLGAWTVVLLLLTGETGHTGESSGNAPLLKDVQIVLQGPRSVGESFIRANLSLREGEPFDRAALNADILALLRTERFSDLRFEATEEAGGIRLWIRATPRYRLSASPTIVGGQRFRRSRIFETLGLERGSYVDDTVLAARCKRVEALYRKSGYPPPTVTWRWIQSAEEVTENEIWRAVTVHIQEERPLRVAGQRVEGVKAPPESVMLKPFTPIRDRLALWALRPLVNEPAWYNFPMRAWRFFFRPYYDETKAVQAAEAIRSALRAQGFWDAEVQGPFDERREGRVYLRYRVSPGPFYRIAAVRVEGVRLFPAGTFDRLTSLRPGQPATQEAIEAAVQEVRSRYHQRGHLGVWLDYELEPAGADRLTVVIRVRNEGRPVRVGEVAIRGNRVTREKVILREVGLFPGDPFDMDKVAQSERRLRNLNYFEWVRGGPEERTANVADLIFQVEEKPTGMLSFGASFSSVDSLVGQIELTQGNFDLFNWPTFMGGGQRLKLSLRAGSRLSEYTLSFVEPWFLDRPLSLGLDTYLTRRSYTDYVVQRAGGSLSLTYPTRLGFNTEWRYRLERISLDDVTATNTYTDVDGVTTFRFVEEETRYASSLGLTLWRDRRDNPFVPSRGYRLSGSATLTGGPLGFDTDLYRLALRAEQHVPLLWGHVLSLRASAEVVEAFGDTDEVPLAERLYCGGPRTVRGFKYRDVGPKAYRTTVRADGTAETEYRPRGGQTLLLASAEYTVPTPVPQIRLAVFGDVGSLAVDPFDFGMEELAWSWGLGVRFNLPYFPIRFDYALDTGYRTPREDRDRTREDRFSFWVGYGF